MNILKVISNFPGGWAIIALTVTWIFLWTIPLPFHNNKITVHPDKVVHLPGFEGDLPSDMYSGYIPVDNGSKMLHYWLIESENDPENDPLLLWLQGGPGSSAMIGLFTEMGPFQVNDNSFPTDGSNEMKVFYNPWTWTKFSNMLFVEAPAGVGYSYWTDGVSHLHTDESAALDNFEFVKNFFEKFPKFKTNKFYLTGESYAGIYIPTLSAHILKMDGINFAGVAVGNGCTGLESEGGCGKDYNYWYANKLWGHGQMSDEIYQSLINSCYDWMKGDAPITTECNNLWEEMNIQVGGFDIYQIYDECVAKGDEISQNFPAPSTYDMSKLQKLSNPFSLSLQQKKIHEISSHSDTVLHAAVNNYPCGSQHAMVAYLANPEVVEALHTKIDYTYQKFQYQSTETSCFKYYNDLIDANKKILIFYGDTDVIVPSNGGEFWTHNMGLEITHPWTSWTPHQDSLWTAGHIVQFEKNFTFLTVKGAGHMVPTFKPEAAYYMMYFWLNDMEWPTQHASAKGWPAYVPTNN